MRIFELDMKHVNEGEEVGNIGDKLQVKVTAMDKEGKRCS